MAHLLSVSTSKAMQPLPSRLVKPTAAEAAATAATAANIFGAQPPRAQLVATAQVAPPTADDNDEAGEDEEGEDDDDDEAMERDEPYQNVVWQSAQGRAPGRDEQCIASGVVSDVASSTAAAAAAAAVTAMSGVIATTTTAKTAATVVAATAAVPSFAAPAPAVPPPRSATAIFGVANAPPHLLVAGTSSLGPSPSPGSAVVAAMAAAAIDPRQSATSAATSAVEDVSMPDASTAPAAASAATAAISTATVAISASAATSAAAAVPAAAAAAAAAFDDGEDIPPPLGDGPGNGKGPDLLDQISDLINPRPPSNRGKIPVTAVRVPIKKRGPVNLPGRRTKMRRSAREIEEDGEAPHVGDPKPPRRTAHSTSALPGEKPVIKWEGMTIFSPGGPSKGGR